MAIDCRLSIIKNRLGATREEDILVRTTGALWSNNLRRGLPPTNEKLPLYSGKW
ncbi:Hypothetical predicted protein, partial [Olea europaea subsp. europaea]